MNYAEQQQLKRRKELIDMIQANAMKNDRTQSVSGRVVPYQIGEGISKLGQALIARKARKSLGEDETRISERDKAARSQSIQDVIGTMQGREQVGSDYPPERQDAPIVADPQKAALMAAGMPKERGLQGVTQAVMANQMKRDMPRPTPKPSYKTIPEMQKSGKWQDRAVSSGVPGELVGDQYQKGAGASDVSATATTEGQGEYVKERLKAQAERVGEMGKSAATSYKGMESLDRFIKASGEGDAGGAQKVMSWTKNLLSSFGYSDESLTDVRVMEQTIGDILGNKMQELGARGLTDKDMEILRESLPRVATDKASRVKVANIVKKSYEKDIEDYLYVVGQEKEKNPELADQIFEPRWMKSYADYKSKQTTPDQEAKGFGDWDADKVSRYEAWKASQ